MNPTLFKRDINSVNCDKFVYETTNACWDVVDTDPNSVYNHFIEQISSTIYTSCFPVKSVVIKK